MSALYPGDWTEYLNILVVFLRLLGFFLLVPVFSHRAIPNNVKILLALSLSAAVYSVVKPYLAPIPQSLSGLFGVALRETLVGLVMGFAAYLTFEGLNLGAQFVGYQMGFGTASLMDPQTQANVSVLVPFQGWIVLMVLFFTDLHHEFIRVFVMSFRLTHAPEAVFPPSAELVRDLVAMAGRLFVLAIQIAAPFTLLILAANAAVGVLSRTMPQFNVMLFSFPITLLLGFAAFYWLAPDLLNYLESILGDVSGDIMTVLRAI